MRLVKLFISKFTEEDFNLSSIFQNDFFTVKNLILHRISKTRVYTKTQTQNGCVYIKLKLSFEPGCVYTNPIYSVCNLNH